MEALLVQWPKLASTIQCNIFQGVFESGITVGLNLKSSLVFEFGTFKSNVTGIELGFLVDETGLLDHVARLNRIFSARRLHNIRDLNCRPNMKKMFVN